MVYCPKCGKEVPSEWTHCPYCGAPLGQLLQQPPPEKKKDRRKVIGAIIGLSGLVGLGYVAYRYYGDEIMAIIERIARETGNTTTITKTTTSTFYQRYFFTNHRHHFFTDNYGQYYNFYRHLVAYISHHCYKRYSYDVSHDYANNDYYDHYSGVS